MEFDLMADESAQNMSAPNILRPRLAALIAEAEKDGIAPDVTIAILISLLDTEDFGVPTTPAGDDA